MFSFEIYYILFIVMLSSIYMYLYLNKYYNKNLNIFFDSIRRFFNEIKEMIDIIDGNVD